jgi:hypothetical protein
MNRRSLGVLAVIIILLMGIVAVAGLDELPRGIRQSAQAAGTQYSADRLHFEAQRAAIESALRSEPDLFRTRAEEWRKRLAAAERSIQEGQTEASSLRSLLEADRREDRQKVQTAVAHLGSLRTSYTGPVDEIRKEAETWLQYKRDLPNQLSQMQSSYQALTEFDLEAATAPARKAITDWPAKREDLQSRVAALSELKSEGGRVWQSSGELRKTAEAGNHESLDYAALFQSAARIKQIAQQLPERANTVNQLAGQLYVSWDKLLLELDEENRERQRVRIIQTRFPDATLQNGATASQEKWEAAGRSVAEDADRSLGMVIERKPAGKYDSEAERTIQPAAYAYVAPPGQANAYGSWSNGVWHWLPQYLILSQLLRGASQPPISTGDWLGYDRARRRGDVYWGRTRQYGRDGSSLRRALDRMRRLESDYDRRASGGGFWRERPKQESPRVGGGYRGSRYQSRGSFSGSRYQSRGGFGMRSYSRAFRGFGRGGRR